LTTLPSPLPAGYEAAATGAAYFHQAQSGYLRISGMDRHAFLQRQTTNDLRDLKAGLSLVTVLTSPAARILDVLTLLEELDAIGVITLPGYGGNTARYLKSRIFFMDKVTLEDASAEYSQIDLIGPQVQTVLQRVGLIIPDGERHVVSGEITGNPVRVLGQHQPGYRLLFPAAAFSEVSAALGAAGTVPLSPEAYEILRIEAGIPAAGHELSEENTPLETGLAWTVSDNKGCYTGQEVIARQITYDKITRQLVGVHLERPAQPGDRLRSLEEKRSVGTVTSAVTSPRFGSIALAIVRRPYHISGIQLTLGDQTSSSTAIVVDLPFTIR
jgi:folate-binding protein YgfZ